MEYPKGERGIATIKNYLKKQLPIACMSASKAGSIDMWSNILKIKHWLLFLYSLIKAVLEQQSKFSVRMK